MQTSHRGVLGGLVGTVIATGLGLLLAVTAPAATPILSLAATNAIVGQTISDSATLSGGFSPTGEVTFSVYGPTDTGCTTPLETSSAPILADHATSADFLAQQVGEFRWTASYPGDANNDPISSTCGAADQSSIVSKATPGLTGSASAATVGNAIHDEVSLTGGFSLGGEVTFSVYAPTDTGCSTALESSTVTIQGADATSADFLPQQAGDFRWTASYPGDANNEAASLPCNAANQSSTVGKAAPGLTGSASAAAVGGAIHDEATLTGGFSPTGQVTFSVYAPSDTGCSTALETTTAPILADHATSADFLPQQVGEFRWRASYPGDANNQTVSSACNAPNQSSIVSKAAPSLVGVATSAAKVGLTISDGATLSGGFSPTGEVTFSVYGATDTGCTTPLETSSAPILAGHATSADFLAPAPGLYRWTVEYPGDANNGSAGLACGATDQQSSAVGAIAVTLSPSATDAMVGQPVNATAAIQEGAIPGGQISFEAFSPTDANCSGAAAFRSVVAVSGNGSYRSAAFVPARVGTFRWTVAYSGDVNHIATTAGCGKATSSISQARPSIAGQVKRRLAVGTSFRDTATLQGGYAPGGTITFQIYGPVAAGCAKPVFVDTVAVAGNGTISSDPFVAQRPGRYSFVATYSGDAANHGATEPCDSVGQVAELQKRTPKVKPRALLTGGKRISIRALLSGGATPSGVINFRLYGPGDKRCRRRPAFSGAISVKANGNYSLAQYLATKSGVYRLSVGYSGDQRNQRYRGSCSSAQPIRVG